MKGCAPYPIGAFREVVTFQRITRTTDGQGGWTETWNELGGAQWVSLTSSPIAFNSIITLQNVGLQDVFVKATTGAVPTDTTGAILYPPDAKETGALTSDLFPGLSGVASLWAYSLQGTSVSLSYTGQEPTTIAVPGSTVATRAIVRPMTGSEAFRFQRIDASAQLMVITRYFSGLTPADRVLIRGLAHNIRDVRNVDFRNDWLEIAVTQGVAT